MKLIAGSLIFLLTFAGASFAGSAQVNDFLWPGRTASDGDGDGDYENGVSAARAGDWQMSVRFLERSVGRDPQDAVDGFVEEARGVGRALLTRMFAEFLAQNLDSAIVWVLAANPARFFYETVDGKRSAEREERLWGADLPEIAYIWRDLTAALDNDLRRQR